MTVIDLRGLEDALGAPTPIRRGLATVQYWAGNQAVIRVEGQDVVFPAAITVPFVNGEPSVTVDLPPTLGICCVRWVFRFGDFTLERFTSIPDVGPVLFGDLPVVDPDTYLPIQPGSTVADTIAAELAAWLAANPPTEGPAGPANVLSIGTVTTLAPGSPATAQITGESPAQVLDLGIPEGDTGPAGDPTAFELRGAGTPEGVVTASMGTYYTDTAATNGAVRWVKASGAGNTGWRVVYGDTGWRDITTVMGGTVTTVNWALVRRVNDKVTFRLSAEANSVWGSADFSLNGFRASTVRPVSFPVEGIQLLHTFHRDSVQAPNGFVAMRTNSFAFYIRPTTSAGSRVGEAVYQTDDAWPTTLPGVPA